MTKRIAFVLLITTILFAKTVSARQDCNDIKIMRARAGDARNVDGTLVYDIKLDVFNRTKQELGPVRVHAERGGKSIGDVVEIAKVASKEKMEVVIPARLGGGLAHGARVDVVVVAEVGGSCRVEETVQLTYFDPNGAMYFIPGFHYDPEWWNTQEHYLENYTKDSGKREVFFLINAYLDMAAADPDYRFILHETDYLKPFSIMYPERMGELRALIAAGRAELGGMSYNEPQETLISTEALIRNTLLGINSQRSLVGDNIGDYTWQLDVFGHSPLYPMVVAGTGGKATAWARGPYHEWAIDRDKNLFPSEFYWVSPDGTELLTHFMSGHYSYGWFRMAPARGGGAFNIGGVFSDLTRTSLTGNIMVPMVDDFATPVLELGDWFREWNADPQHPKAVIATPGMFFDKVNESIDEKNIHVPRVSMDFNPIFPGCAVSYTDTKQANRADENTLLTAEKFGAVAMLLTCNDGYPFYEMDKAWRQLAYTSHHDGITGSHSDQVYLDLLGSWREAYDIGTRARDHALSIIASKVDTRPPAGLSNATPVVVFNPVSWKRTDVVFFDIKPAQKAAAVYDFLGNEIPAQIVSPPAHCKNNGDCAMKIAFIAKDVPATGYSVFFVADNKDKGIADGSISESTDKSVFVESNEFKAVFDPALGGGMTSLVDRKSKREYISGGGPANEIVVYHEYPALPGKGEGPWHLNPTGKKEYARTRSTIVRAEKGPVFTRVTSMDAKPVSDDEVEETKFTTLETEPEPIRDASNFKVRTFDLSKFVGADGKVYVKFSDAFPDDGWGALVGKVKFTTTKNGAAQTVSFTPASKDEKPFLKIDGGSIDPAGRRFADGGASWVYVFEASPNAPATLELELGNQYVIAAADVFLEPETPFYRVQEAWFYTGVSRVDFRTYIVAYRGHDRMFRVHFPLDVGGRAIPVYEIGNAAVGRNFGYDVDTAQQPWTLGNTAYNWVDLSHVFFLEERNASGAAVRRESVGIGEVVIGDTATLDEEKAADALIRAMARAGATATPTRASTRRCCDISMDSVNAQFRIVIGNFSSNSLAAELIAKLPEQTQSRIKDELRKNAHAAVFMPKNTTEIPTILLLATDDFEAWMQSLTDNIKNERALVVVNTAASAASGDTKTAPAGAALINLGTPSYIAYDDNGKYTLALSLMRGSSAWPSGVWLDPPRRKPPAGDNFQFENWDHEFQYSLYPHDGAWYEAGTVNRGYEYNFPLIARTEKSHEGILPIEGLAFAETNPSNVILSAMAPLGFQATANDWKYRENIAFRFFEATGNDTNGKISFFRDIESGTKLTDYTENTILANVNVEHGDVNAPIPGFHTATAMAKPVDFQKWRMDCVQDIRAHPVDMVGTYARYWRWNTGAAPLGNMPVSVILRPDEVIIAPDQKSIPFELVISNVANEKSIYKYKSFEMPEGFSVKGDFDGTIEPGGYAVIPIEVTIPQSSAIPERFTIRASFGFASYDIARVTVESQNPIHVDLNGKWDIQLDASNWKPGKKKSGTWMKIDVPGFWEKQLYPYDGTAVYRREIDIPDAGGRALVFDFTKGVDDAAEVYLNGNRICPELESGNNQQFECAMGDVKPGRALLEVKVRDNGGDGGIGGDVVLRTPIDDDFARVELLTPRVEVAPCGRAEVRYRVHNRTPQPAKGTILVLSPFETWDWLPAAVQFTAPADGFVDVAVPISVPAGAPVFNTWVSGKVLIHGQLFYTEVADVRGVK